jgi:hypothetical protein
MEDKIQLKFEGLTDPKEIWETTKQKYGTHGYLENERLINNIVKLKLSACKGVQDYCDRFNAALEELSRGSGESMPEEYALVHWFNGLGDKHEIWRATVHTEFRMRPDNKVKLKELQLIDHAASDSKENGNGVMQAGSNTGSNTNKDMRGKGRGNDRKASSNTRKDYDSKLKCDLCDATGYEKSKCFYADLNKAPQKWQEVLIRIAARQKVAGGIGNSKAVNLDDYIAAVINGAFATMLRDAW